MAVLVLVLGIVVASLFLYFDVSITSFGVTSVSNTPAPKGLPVCFESKGCFDAEVAASPLARERGLMDRTSLAPNHSMLFVFPVPDQARLFWMKNMRFPLDIVWINSEKKIVGISKNVPPCEEIHCPSFASPAPASFVLEINAFAADERGLKIGDRVSFPDINVFSE